MNKMRAVNPLAPLILGIWAVWGFGVQAVGLRLRTEADGVVISSRDTPSTGAPRYATEYTIRGLDGRDRGYIAGPTYGSLPRSMPIGTQIKKQRWHLDYQRNGRPVNDFPILFSAVILGIACSCLAWSFLLWRDQRRFK
jgi:hypothetical protein